MSVKLTTLPEVVIRNTNAVECFTFFLSKSGAFPPFSFLRLIEMASMKMLSRLLPRWYVKRSSFATALCLTTPLSKCKIPQSTLAALLPSEILVEIYEYLGSIQVASIEQEVFGPPHRRSTLPVLALVCRSWSSVAMQMLYHQALVTSPESLKLFVRTLRSSKCRAGSVYCFTYKGQSTDTVCYNSKEARREVKSIIESISLLKDSGRANLCLNLLIPHTCAAHLLLIPEINDVNLTSLHIAATLGPPSRSFPKSISFTNLRTLALDFVILDSSLVWPEMPNLRTLKLKEAALISIGGNLPDFSQLKRLTRLEMMHTHYQENCLPVLLELCSRTLEHLVLIDVSGPEESLVALYSLRHMTALRTVCLGPFAFLSADLPDFSESLECLTIWEFDNDFFFWPLHSLNNTDGLYPFLEKSSVRQNLKRIRVRGLSFRWAPKEEMFRNLCAERGIEFELRTFDCKPVLVVVILKGRVQDSGQSLVDLDYRDVFVGVIHCL